MVGFLRLSCRYREHERLSPFREQAFAVTWMQKTDVHDFATVPEAFSHQADLNDLPDRVAGAGAGAQ